MRMASPRFASLKDDGRLSQDASDDEVESEEALDPRVKGELERLNTATTEINRLEQALEEMHAVFRQTLTESAFVLKSHANRMNKFINLSRPYYEALERSKQAQIATQRAALKYERACCKHQAAKEMVSRAEQKLLSTSTEHKTMDPTWQEMLNKATMNVMEAEREKSQSETEHLETAHKFTRIGKEVQDLKSKLKTAITKSKTYFDLRGKYMDLLEGHKHDIGILQQQLQEAKKNYSLSLKKLEGISDEIHELRQSQDSLSELCSTVTREAGVGAEAPMDPVSVYEEATAAWTSNDFALSITVISDTSPTHKSTALLDKSAEVTDGIYLEHAVNGCLKENFPNNVSNETSDRLDGCDKLDVAICNEELVARTEAMHIEKPAEEVEPVDRSGSMSPDEATVLLLEEKSKNIPEIQPAIDPLSEVES